MCVRHLVSSILKCVLVMYLESFTCKYDRLDMLAGMGTEAVFKTFNGLNSILYAFLNG